MKKKLPILIGLIFIAGLGFFLFKKYSKRPPSQDQTVTTPSPTPTNLLTLESTPKYEVSSQNVNYYGNVNGYLAKPAQDGTYPGIVMIHEWWGLNDNIREMAKLLASQGYIVLAVDLHNGKVAQTADEARELTSSLNQDEALNNMKAAREYLIKGNADKIAGLGWCFGGKQSLQLALSGVPLDATVIYYGSLETDQNKLSSIKWPVLGVFGGEDQSIPVDSVKEFETGLKNLKVENEIYIYPKVGHAFANPSNQNYAPEETKDAWAKSLSFLEKHLQKTSNK